MKMLSEHIVRQRIKQYFHINELVGRRTHKKYGNRAWQFLDYRLLYALLIIRENIGKPIRVNYGNKHQRGLRTIIQQIVKQFMYNNKLYISPHIQGKAVDFDVIGMTADEVRQWIIDNKRLFPFKIRLEKNVRWVHMDVRYCVNNPKVYLFTA